MFQFESGADAPKVPPANVSRSEPHQERVTHVLYGSLLGLDRTIKILHVRGLRRPQRLERTHAHAKAQSVDGSFDQDFAD